MSLRLLVARQTFDRLRVTQLGRLLAPQPVPQRAKEHRVPAQHIGNTPDERQPTLVLEQRRNERELLGQPNRGAKLELEQAERRVRRGIPQPREPLRAEERLGERLASGRGIFFLRRLLAPLLELGLFVGDGGPEHAKGVPTGLDVARRINLALHSEDGCDHVGAEDGLHAAPLEDAFKGAPRRLGRKALERRADLVHARGD